MMKTRIFFSACASIAMFCASCSPSAGVSSGQDDVATSLSVSFSPATETTTLSALFPSARVVRLETNERSLVGGRTNKVLRRSGGYYISTGNEVVCFDRDGRFTKRFNRVGSGPEEYVQMYDFDVVCPDGQAPEMWISTKGGIQMYDLQTAEWRRRLKVDTHVNQSHYVNDSTIILVTPDESPFLVVDMQGHVRQAYGANDPANAGVKSVQFATWQNLVLYLVDDTYEAVAYDTQADDFSTLPLFQTTETVLTRDANQAYYQKYGYMKQSDEVAHDFIRLSAFRTFQGQVLMTTFHPDGQSMLTWTDGQLLKTYCFAPQAPHLQGDLVATESLRYLATLICCDSDAGFLLMVPAALVTDGVVTEDDNPVLIDIPFGS